MEVNEVIDNFSAIAHTITSNSPKWLVSTLSVIPHIGVH